MNLRAAVSDAPVEPESLHAASRCVNGQPRYNWTSSFFDTRALDLPQQRAGFDDPAKPNPCGDAAGCRRQQP